MKKLEIVQTENYLLAVSDGEIKEGDICLDGLEILSPYEITDIVVYKFQEIVAYLPINNAPELELPLLPDIVVENDVEKLAEKHAKKVWGIYVNDIHPDVHITQTNGKISANDFITGYKAATKVYSEEDLREVIKMAQETILIDLRSEDREHKYSPEEIIQSIKQSKTPKYFIAETKTTWVRNTDRNVPTKEDFDEELKTITINSKIYLIGTYEY